MFDESSPHSVLFFDTTAARVCSSLKLSGSLRIANVPSSFKMSDYFLGHLMLRPVASVTMHEVFLLRQWFAFEEAISTFKWSFMGFGVVSNLTPQG